MIKPHKPCKDYAPDTLNPNPEDRDICTTCFYRKIDHPMPQTRTRQKSLPSWDRWASKHEFDIQAD